MAEPFQAELQATVDRAETATSLDDAAAVALAGSFYKDFKSGRTVTTFGPGWSQLARVSPAGGYDGIALYHAASKSLVVLNRGTEGFSSLPDWIQNVGAALFNSPGPQLDAALQLLLEGFSKAPSGGVDQILICGHSLGGALADAQGALAESLFARDHLTCPPVRVVGVASAGFARSARSLAEDRGLQVSPDARAFITHYVRAKDVVPNHFGREIFGKETHVASVFETRDSAPNAPRAVGREWRVVEDLVKQHQRTLYLQYLDVPGDQHLWFSAKTKTFHPRPGATPDWEVRFGRPQDW